MREAVYAKFSLNKEIKEALLSANDSIIVEQTTDNYFWGCGKDVSEKK